MGIEPNGTWEEMYEFFPITLVGRFLYINYKEPYNQNKDYRERFNVVDPETKQDLSYMLSWIIKSIKKGFKEEGKIDVLKFRLNQGVDESAIVETKFKLKLKDNTPPAEFIFFIISFLSSSGISEVCVAEITELIANFSNLKSG